MMIVSCFIAMSISSVSDIEEFFPLDPGRTWFYSDNGITTAGASDRVSNPQEVGGKLSTPIVTVINGKVDGSTFYRIEGDQVIVVAFEQNRPIASPYPILMFGPGKNSWEYSGSTQWLGEPAPMTIKGTTKKSGSRELFGSKRDTIEVTLDAVIGEGNGINMKSHQVSTYARGIGLVELTDQTTMKKTKTVRKRKLVSFTPGKEG